MIHNLGDYLQFSSTVKCHILNSFNFKKYVAVCVNQIDSHWYLLRAFNFFRAIKGIANDNKLYNLVSLITPGWTFVQYIGFEKTVNFTDNQSVFQGTAPFSYILWSFLDSLSLPNPNESFLKFIFNVQTGPMVSCHCNFRMHDYTKLTLVWKAAFKCTSVAL